MVGLGALFFLLLAALPWVAILINIGGFFEPELKIKKTGWALTVISASIWEMITFCPMNGHSSRHWSKQLVNQEVHEAFNGEFGGIYIAITIIGILAFLILATRDMRETPPLVSVLAIAAMYLASAKNIVYLMQISGRAELSMGYILLVNLFIVKCSLMREKISEWNRIREEKMKSGELDERQLSWYEGILGNALTWPLFALLAAIPLLGVILSIAVFCGQRPDALISAWTETAEWRFSQRIAPPNVRVDEHYLCTVAAGGHEKVVKPIRMGERHGHRVVVNRQLEVANAFELVLEWKTPKLHRVIRNFYDKYGFPIARCIRTKTACDVVYVIMKPLEWFFTIVLYLTLVHPENVIAVQYMPGYRDVLDQTERGR